MRTMKIAKGNGKYRVVYCPSRGQKAAMRKLIPELEAIVRQQMPPDVVHGFLTGRSPVTNALGHVGYQYSVCMDLESFFDTVTPDMVDKAFAKSVATRGFVQKVFKLCFVDGAARQGLPTSPILGNLAALDMDWELENLLRPFVYYTRYADDLSFSFNDPKWIETLLDFVPKVVTKFGFKLNEGKTKVQDARAGRRNITGVMVDDRLHASRSVRRRLRAASHQANIHQVRGLAEWMALKLPEKWQKEEAELFSSGVSVWDAVE
jgi:hypothetical protein